MKEEKSAHGHMGHFPQDGENEQNVSYFFEAFLRPNGLIFLSFLNFSEEIMSVGRNTKYCALSYERYKIMRIAI